MARQGDPKAIAALINRSLQPKGIAAKISLKGSCLQILLEADQVPDQETLIQFLTRGIIKLDISDIETLKIFGRQRGEEVPNWSQDVFLHSPSQDSSENIKSREHIDKNVLSQPASLSKESSQVSKFKTSESILVQSKNVAFPILKNIWKWYTSGFKSRPDLPLYTSPRLYRILLTFFAFIWITTPLGLYKESTSDSSVSSTRPSNTNKNSKFLCSQDNKGNPKHILEVDNTRFEITRLDDNYYQVLGVEDIRLGNEADFAYTIGYRDQISYYGGYPRLAPGDMDELVEVEAWFIAVGRTCNP